jgi:HEAT repeat protein
MKPTPPATGSRSWEVALVVGLGLALSAATFARPGNREPVYQGEPLGAWMKHFDSTDHAIHERALAALRELGPAAVAPVSKELLRPDPLFTRVIRPLIARFPWIRIGVDEAEHHRIHAVQMLGEIGPPSRTAIPALIHTVQDPKCSVPPAIVHRALLDIGSASAPLLVAALDNERVPVREFAANTLFTIIEDRGISEPAQRAALAPLVKLLKDAHPTERALAAAILGRIGPRARPTTSALVAALRDVAPEVRARAALALNEIDADPNTAVPPLTGALKDITAAVRRNAAIGLGRFGRDARDGAAALASSLTDEDESVRVNAANALGRIGEADGRIVSALSAHLDDPSALVRASAAAALGKLGPGAVNAVPALIRLVDDDDAQVRGSAATALGKLGPAASPAVPVLMRALRDEQYSVRICAIEALGELGPPASTALPALRQTQVNDFAGLGRYVAVALKKIDPSPASKQAALSPEGD